MMKKYYVKVEDRNGTCIIPMRNQKCAQTLYNLYVQMNPNKKVKIISKTLDNVLEQCIIVSVERNRCK